MAKIEKRKRLFGGRQGIIAFALLISFVFPPFVTLSEEQRPIKAAPRRPAKDIFIACAGCHKIDGRGGTGYGGFAANFHETKLTHDEIVAVITFGRRKRGMPPFKGILGAREIDAMATFIETEFKGKP